MNTTSRFVVIGCLSAAGVVVQRPSDESTRVVPRLHDTAIKPASDHIFGVGRQAPTSDKDWLTMASAGGALIKAGSALTLASPTTNRAIWLTQSRRLADAGQQVRQAAESRDLDAVTLISDRLVVVCESCHAPYRQPRARQ